MKRKQKAPISGLNKEPQNRVRGAHFEPFNSKFRRELKKRECPQGTKVMPWG